MQSDAELLSAVRSGDAAAFGAIYERHNQSVTLTARKYERDPNRADDLVSEAFARLLRLLQEGKGPTETVRQYLYVIVRNLANDHVVDIRSSDAFDELEDTMADASTTDVAQLEVLNQTIVTNAFNSLPDRWQNILWMVDVEGMKPAAAAQHFGMTANSCSALLHRARGALAEAYLGAHLTARVSEDCSKYVNQLPAYVRSTLSKSRVLPLRKHLESCEDCRVAEAEIRDTSLVLRAVIAPLLVGGVVAGSLWPASATGASAAVIAGAGASAGVAGGAGAGGAGGSSGGAGATGGFLSGLVASQGVLIGAGAAVALGVAAAIAVPIAINSGNDQPGSSAIAAERPADIASSAADDEDASSDGSATPAPPEKSPEPEVVPTTEVPGAIPTVPYVPTPSVPNAEPAPEAPVPPVAPPTTPTTPPTTPPVVPPVDPPIIPPVDPPVSPDAAVVNVGQFSGAEAGTIQTLSVSAESKRFEFNPRGAFTVTLVGGVFTSSQMTSSDNWWACSVAQDPSQMTCSQVYSIFHNTSSFEFQFEVTGAVGTQVVATITPSNTHTTSTTKTKTTQATITEPAINPVPLEETDPDLQGASSTTFGSEPIAQAAASAALPADTTQIASDEPTAAVDDSQATAQEPSAELPQASQEDAQPEPVDAGAASAEGTDAVAP
ncbi:sigma-70 family RNA polymerase sigma factor [Lysinibacter cavernae]|uniref:RNA polymerase sigma factor (Sigma-70 family) n=1 Tax=Lysinibacter cavernae TaxID=1640652 RepID=A0A7X5R297_9MICO|nr:sigma-70 family RNA polymerase sigma factor [Lysinibacter cavernae]NIH54274.1 RNA polymerase sigma factor (sigma-70 family) [Lysinibacter cavernae]